MPIRWVLLAAAWGCVKHQAPAPPLDVQVTVDGRATWPPQGEGCDQLVACCDAMAELEPSVALACRLGVATGDPCAVVRSTVSAIFAEKTSQSPPAACTGG